MKNLMASLIILGSFSFPLTMSLAETKRTVVVKPKVVQAQLDLASMSAKLSAVFKVKNAKAAKENGFNKIVDCDAADMGNPVLEFTGKCFEFFIGQMKSQTVQAPITIVNATGPKGFETAKGSQDSQNEMDWGQISVWKTSGKSAYVFLAPKEKEQMVRIGPMPASLLNHYDIEWKIDSW